MGKGKEDGMASFQQRATSKVVKLRQLAIRAGIHGEAYELFKEIEADPECNRMLREANKTNKSMAERYNQHVRKSKLSNVDKRDLSI